MGNLTAQPAGGGGAQCALSNLANVAVNTTLVPCTDDTIDLGTDSIRFKDGYFRGTLTVFDLTVESGSSIKLAGATFENEGHYTSVDTNFMVKHSDQDTAFIGVYSEGVGTMTHANLVLDAQGSTLNLLKNSPIHPWAPKAGGIINEGGNFGLMVNHDSEISFQHFETLTKDEYGNVTYLSGLQTLGRFLDTGDETEFQIEHGTGDTVSFFVNDLGNLRLVASGGEVAIGGTNGITFDPNGNVDCTIFTVDVEYTWVAPTFKYSRSSEFFITTRPYNISLVGLGNPSRFMNFGDGTIGFDLWGHGVSPEGLIVADTGSLSIDAGAGKLYIKTTDTVNTGWEKLLGQTDADLLYDAVGVGATVVATHEANYNHANYDTAFGWGNHSIAGYLTSEVWQRNGTELLPSTSGDDIRMDGGKILLARVGGKDYGMQTVGIDFHLGQEDDLVYYGASSTWALPNGQLDLGWFGIGGILNINAEDGGTAGAQVHIFVGADYDNDITKYTLRTSEDDLTFGPNTDPDAFKFVGNGSAVIAECNVNLLVNGTISGIDADNWNTAYGWGDHSTEGYLTAETDPMFGAWDKSTGISITTSQVSDHSYYVADLLGIGQYRIPYGTGFGGLQDSANFTYDGSNFQVNSNVGIGDVAVPGAYPLEVATSGSDPVSFRRGSNNSVLFKMDSTNNDIRFGGGKAVNRIGTWIDQPFGIVANSSEALTIGTDGAVSLSGAGTLKVPYKIQTPHIYNDAGILKLQPEAIDNVELFGDADIDNAENGKMLYVRRRAAEGNTYLRFYISSGMQAYMHASCPLTLQAQQPFTINSVTDDINFKMGDNAGSKKIYFKDSDNNTVGYVDSNGNAQFDGKVGIGAASDQLPLEVSSADDKQVMCIDTTAQAQGVGGGVAFGGNATDAGPHILAGEINCWKTNSVSGHYGFDMHLETQDSVGFLTTRIKLTSEGLCGVGDFTSLAPVKTLDVNGDGYIRGDLGVGISPAYFLHVQKNYEGVLQTRFYNSNSDGVMEHTVGASGGGHVRLIANSSSGYHYDVPGGNAGIVADHSNLVFCVGSGGSANLAMTLTTTGLDIEGELIVRDISPHIHLEETDANTNEKVWEFSANNGVFAIQTRTDGYSAGSNAFKISRSGTTLQVISFSSDAQVSIGTDTPEASAALEIKSTTGALLFPRMTTTQRNALTPVNGMIVYDTTQNSFRKYQADAWTSI